MPVSRPFRACHQEGASTSGATIGKDPPSALQLCRSWIKTLQGMGLSTPLWQSHDAIAIKALLGSKRNKMYIETQQLFYLKR